MTVDDIKYIPCILTENENGKEFLDIPKNDDDPHVTFDKS